MSSPHKVRSALAKLRRFKMLTSSWVHFFSVCIVGEFNTGKSTFINALLGEKLLDSDEFPCTSKITVLHHPSAQPQWTHDEVLIIPCSWLHNVQLVDTPGTNAVMKEHTRLATDFVPKADLIIFITSVERPFCESEREFLEQITEWRKKVVLVLNKTDLSTTPESLEQVAKYVRNKTALYAFSETERRFLAQITEWRKQARLDTQTMFFAVSALNALDAKLAHKEIDPSWVLLEKHIFEELTLINRVQRKLLSPVGIIMQTVDRFLGVLDEQAEPVRQNTAVLSRVDDLLQNFEQDLKNDKSYIAASKGVGLCLDGFQARARAFLDTHLSHSASVPLINRGVAKEFRKEVIFNWDAQMESHIETVSQRFLVKTKVNAQDILDLMRKTSSLLTSEFSTMSTLKGLLEVQDDDRLSPIEKKLLKALETFDPQAEGETLEQAFNTAVLTVSSMGILGITSASAAVLLSNMWGFAFTGVFFTLGCSALPCVRWRTRNHLDKCLEELRQHLIDVLDKAAMEECRAYTARIRSVLRPFQRSVEVRQDKDDKTKQVLEDIRAKAKALNRKVFELRAQEYNSHEMIPEKVKKVGKIHTEEKVDFIENCNIEIPWVT